MNLAINKTKTIAVIAVFLLLASIMQMAKITVQLASAQLASEQQTITVPSGVTPDTSVPTLAHLSFRPNPIGVGQPLLINVWLQPPTGLDKFLIGLTVTITKPDGTSVVYDQIKTIAQDASSWFEFVPDQVGEWKIKFDFPGNYFPAGRYYNGYIVKNTSGTLYTETCYYQPSSDGPYELVVQEEQVLSWPQSPLPTDYWTRPVSPENREWWPILGYYPSAGVVGGGINWPADTNIYADSAYDFTPYVQAPKTAHIVWRRQDAIGGLMGGPAGQHSWASISWTSGAPSPATVGNAPAIVYAGRCYETLTKVVDGVTTSVWQCYDLRTGEVYWEKTGVPSPSWVSFEDTPVNAYLVAISGGRLIKYDPWVGVALQNASIAPLTTGTLYFDPYFLTVQNLGSQVPVDQRYRLINWTVVPDSRISPYVGLSPISAHMVVMNNVTWPFSSLGTVDYEAGIAANTYSITPLGTGTAIDAGIMAASLTTGALLWNVTAGVGFGIFSTGTGIADHGKFAVRFNDGYWRCWDLYSGKQLWKSELSSWPWGTFGSYDSHSAYGLLYYTQYDGLVAYDWDTGKVVWWYKYKAPYPYETPYQEYTSIRTQSRIADGIIYSANSEHTPTQPITRGWKLHAVNATTGEGIWNITGVMPPGAVADGYLTAFNIYDGYMYVFGKGRSATTVTAPDVSVPLGTSFTIKGTVLDQSPAQAGTPCVSKGSMATYMEYLHMQRSIAGIYGNETITGVPVTLTAYGSDGTTINIGTVTTNGYYGTFSQAWTPPKEDTYTIMAIFAGDDSYGSSSAATAVTVGPAPASPTPTPTPPEAAPDNTPLLYGILAAVIVAIIISIYAVLRKRP